LQFSVAENRALGLTLSIDGNQAARNGTNKMNNTIKISNRYSNLTEAVAATGMDLSYNEADARQTIRIMELDQRLKLVAIFSDETNQIWYVINSVSENLNLLHKFYPFGSMMSDSPFKVLVPMKDGEVSDLDQADNLKQIGLAKKENKSRRVIANAGMIAG
jgi:hypothetical protein